MSEGPGIAIGLENVPRPSSGNRPVDAPQRAQHRYREGQPHRQEGRDQRHQPQEQLVPCIGGAPFQRGQLRLERLVGPGGDRVGGLVQLIQALCQPAGPVGIIRQGELEQAQDRRRGAAQGAEAGGPVVRHRQPGEPFGRFRDLLAGGAGGFEQPRVVEQEIEVGGTLVGDQVAKQRLGPAAELDTLPHQAVGVLGQPAELRGGLHHGQRQRDDQQQQADQEQAAEGTGAGKSHSISVPELWISDFHSPRSKYEIRYSGTGRKIAIRRSRWRSQARAVRTIPRGRHGPAPSPGCCGSARPGQSVRAGRRRGGGLRSR